MSDNVVASGLIACFDRASRRGSIAAADGRSFSFSAADLKASAGDEEPEPGMRCTFVPEGQSGAVSVCIDERSFAPDEVPLRGEDEVHVLSGTGLPPGYYTLEVSEVPLERTDRRSAKARERLVAAARRYGGNALMEFQEERFIRHSVGFAFYMYRVRAKVALIGMVDPHGRVLAGDLRAAFRRDLMRAEWQSSCRARQGMKILRITAVLMFLVFLGGFVASKFVH